MTIEQELMALREHCQSFVSDRNMQDVVYRLTQIMVRERARPMAAPTPSRTSDEFNAHWQNGMALDSPEAQWAWAGWQGVFDYLGQDNGRNRLVPGDEATAKAMILSGLQWYQDRECLEDLPTEMFENVVGDMVSIDVSTCDEDADHRVFGKIIEWQRPGPDGGRVWLCDLDQFNYDPTQPVNGDSHE